MLGYDRFFFFRPLTRRTASCSSPSTARRYVFERRESDFRANGLQKPGSADGVLAGAGVHAGRDREQAVPHRTREELRGPVCVRQRLLSIALLTTTCTGGSSPARLLAGGAASSASSDVDDASTTISSERHLGRDREFRRAILGTFRAHDMAQLRVTYQLN